MFRCAVCRVTMEKTRVHYGGVSCYSCRAFFRRTSQVAMYNNVAVIQNK